MPSELQLNPLLRLQSWLVLVAGVAFLIDLRHTWEG